MDGLTVLHYGNVEDHILPSSAYLFLSLSALTIILTFDHYQPKSTNFHIFVHLAAPNFSPSPFL